ncbi:hypothetical protein [Streptosporangium sp. NPDC000396]
MSEKDFPASVQVNLNKQNSQLPTGIVRKFLPIDTFEAFGDPLSDFIGS